MTATSALCRQILGLALAASLSACLQPTASAQWELAPVQVTAVTLNLEDPALTTAGELVFRGGLEIKAAKKSAFGGISGLVVDGEDRLVAITDQGSWITAALERGAAGTMTGLLDVKIAAMRGLDGAALDTKRWADAEDLSRLPDGRFAVSFEQVHRLWAYDLDGEGPMAKAEALQPLAGANAMLANEGLEGIAALPDGRILGVAEFPPRGDDAPYWLMEPLSETPAPAHGGFALTGGYGLVGLAALPNGDVIALERFFLPVIGVRLNVKVVEAAKLDAANRRIDGRLIASLEPPMALDNFEAVSAVVAPDGKVRIFMISDNNFSSNQRTLLFAFEWTPPAPVAALAPPAAMGGIEGEAVEPAGPGDASTPGTMTGAAAETAAALLPPAPPAAAGASQTGAQVAAIKPPATAPPKPAAAKPKPKPPAPAPAAVAPAPVEPAPLPPPPPPPARPAGPEL